MFSFKCFKKAIVKRRLLKLMKSENIMVRECCSKRDWKNVGKWLHINKSSFKAFKRINKL